MKERNGEVERARLTKNLRDGVTQEEIDTIAIIKAEDEVTTGDMVRL